MPHVEIIAHRGASADAPENTLAAIQLAWQYRADAAEIDIMFTSDGQVVAIHDDSTRRTGGVDWAVVEHTLAELKTLDVGSWKSSRFANERIPTLAEVLEIVPPGKRLFIEVKCDVSVIPELTNVLSVANTSREQTVLISLDFDTIVAVKRALPDRIALWVTEQFATGNADAPLRPATSELIERAVAANLDGLDINDLVERPNGDIAQILQAGLETCIWTVNSVERALWLRAEGMSSITTDVPARLRAALSEPVVPSVASESAR